MIVIAAKGVVEDVPPIVDHRLEKAALIERRVGRASLSSACTVQPVPPCLPFIVTCSMSRSSNVWDNAATESFFSSLKTESDRGSSYFPGGLRSR